MNNKLDLVRRYELQGFLRIKMQMTEDGARNEASNLWSILVDASDVKIGQEGMGLPLRLICTKCGKAYGECNDLFKYVSRDRGSYSSKQNMNWAFELNSLLEARQIIMRRDIRRLGSPQANRVPRQRLMAWLDHLAQ